MAITNWNKSTLELLRRDMEAALKGVMTKHGLMDIGGISMKYSANKTQVKFDVYVKPSNFVAPTTSITAMESVTLRELGCPIGTTLRSEKYGTCTVIGYNSRKRKCPITTRNTAGQEIGFAEFGIKSRVIALPAGYVAPAEKGQLTLRRQIEM